jgi:hypothetical protein
MFFEDRLMEFRAEVATGRDEGVEDDVIAKDPRHEASDSEATGEGSAKERRKKAGFGFERAEEHPHTTDREEEKQSGVEKDDEA